ncbi:MAG: MFS transporter [Gemmatimonadetes bacterium]|nr:MAG: MFS transporter [Gemmatimonadota bacterium]
MKERFAFASAYLESESFLRAKRNTERFLKIRPDDWTILLLLFGLLLALNVALGAADMPTKALFYSLIGKSKVPPMLFFNAILGATAAIAISAFVDKLNKTVLFMWTTAGLTVVAIISRIIVGNNPPTWILYFLFVLTNAFRGLLFMLFWLVAAEICDTRRAKRIFGIVTSGGTIGSILCYFVISRLATVIGTEHIYVLWILSLFACTLICYYIINNRSKLGIAVSRPVRRSFTLRDAVQNVIEGAQIVWSEISLAKVLFFASIFYFALSYTTDVAFESALADRHAQDQMTSVMSLFKGIAFFGALFAQLMLSNKIIQSVGVHNSMLSAPITYAIGFLTLVLAASWGGGSFLYWTVVMMAISRDLIYFSIYSPGYQSMYNSISEDKRGRAKAFADGVGVPIAGGIAAIITGAMTHPDLEAWYGVIMLIPFMLSLAFLYVGFRVGRTYLQALMQDLQKDEIVFEKETRAEVDALLRSLTGEDKETALHAARRIATQGHGNPRIPAEMLNLFGNISLSDVKLEVIRTLGQIGDEQTAAELLKLLKSGQPKPIQLAIIHALCRLNYAPAVEVIKPYFEDTVGDMELRAAAAATLMHFGDETGTEFLRNLLNDTSSSRKLAALKTIAEIPAPALVNEINQTFKTTITDIRRYACRALGWIQEDKAIRPLIVAMSDRDSTVQEAAQEALVNHGERILKPLLVWLRSTQSHASADLQQRIVHVMGRVEGEQGEQALIELLSSDNDLLRTAAISALASRGELRERERLEQYILEEISTIYRNLLYVALLDTKPYQDTKAGTMIRILLLEENDRKKDQIIQAVGLLAQELDALELVARKIKSPDNFIRANALETLENFGDRIGSRSLIKHILPLMESPHNENILNRFRSVKQGLGANVQRVLVALLKSSNPIVRACAVYLIGEVREQKLMGIMSESCSLDPDLLVRDNVKVAVNRIVFPNRPEDPDRPMTPLEKIFFLKKVPLFQNMMAEDIRRVADICEEQKVNAGTIIMKENEPVDSPKLYVVVSGMPPQMSNLNPQGVSIPKFKKEGQYFGDIEVFSPETKPVAASTVETSYGDARLFVIDGRRLRAEMERNPTMAIEICRVFSKNVRDTMKLVVNDHYAQLPTWGENGK